MTRRRSQTRSAPPLGLLTLLGSTIFGSFLSKGGPKPTSAQQDKELKRKAVARAQKREALRAERKIKKTSRQS